MSALTIQTSVEVCNEHFARIEDYAFSNGVTFVPNDEPVRNRDDALP